MPKKPRRKSCSPKEGGDDRFTFDEEAAARAERFVEIFCRHWQGEYAGKLFKLLPWQRDVVRQVFGWKRRTDGTRRYRRVSVWVPRGNGKTPFAAAIALCLLFTSGEKGAEIYSVAADKKQATIAFEDGKQMVLQSKPLRTASKVFRRAIAYPKNGSRWEVMSSDAKTKHGYRPFVVIFDELHTQKSRELWSALQTGLGKRKAPLLISISTAGVYDPESLAWDEYCYARKVKDGVVEDPFFLPVIFEAEETDDWADPKTWAKANPGLGITIMQDQLEAECRQALETPAMQAEFRQFRLNTWVRAVGAEIDPKKWAGCNEPPLIEGKAPCWAGLDIGERDDLAALGLWFPNSDGRHSVLVELFIPAEKVLQLERLHRVPYRAWVEKGIVTVAGEHSVDTAVIRKRLNALRTIYNIREVGFDPWNAYRLAQELGEEDGFTVVELRQGSKTLSEPVKDFLALIPEKKLRHGGNPALDWMASNFCVRRDANGNVAPRKMSKNQKIDGISALLNAWARARLAGGKKPGIRVVVL